MKIAHLTTVDLSLRYLLMRQLSEAAEVGEAIGISAPGEFVPELEQRGIRHVPLSASTRGMNLLADVKAMAQLWRILRRERPQILHTHNPKPGLYGRVLGRLAGVPIVINTVHGLYATEESPFLKRILVYALEAIAARFSDAELVQNPEDLQTLHRLHLVSRRKLRLLGNGVDLRRFSPGTANARRLETRVELGLDRDEVAVGMVGRLVAEKGIPELVEAAALLPSNARLFVVGPFDLDKADALDEEVIRRGKEIGIEFLGMRSDVEALYGAFDIFVLPSHREGFPRAAMEAAASGLPLVLTDIRGCRQVVADGVNGFLVPVQDPVALASALETLIEDEDSRARMGQSSADRAEKEFDEKRVVEIVMDTYREVAQRKGLAWGLLHHLPPPELRPAELSDASALARLHSETIRGGFLSSLGAGFLTVLYASLIESRLGSVVVAESDGVVVGFISGVDDTGEFYKEFLRRKFPVAIWRLAPSLLRPGTWKSVWETLRYGGGEQRESAELLSMAVAPAFRRTGLGTRLVRALIEEVTARGLGEMRVVVGADNPAALALYTSCGFSDLKDTEVHRGVPSWELTWRA